MWDGAPGIFEDKTGENWCLICLVSSMSICRSKSAIAWGKTDWNGWRTSTSSTWQSLSFCDCSVMANDRPVDLKLTHLNEKERSVAWSRGPPTQNECKTTQWFLWIQVQNYNLLSSRHFRQIIVWRADEEVAECAAEFAVPGVDRFLLRGYLQIQLLHLWPWNFAAAF